MCGIVGYVNKEKNKKKTIEEMAEKISHRGPDGEGYYTDSSVAFAHKRLAIIDLNLGVQPKYNEDKTLVIVFNGEIYNYKPLKIELGTLGHKFKSDSDTEVIVHGYEEWGSDVVNHLRGMFAFAIWDKKEEELFIARDPFGIKPLYYTLMEDTFMFASEIKAFLPHPKFKKELNEEIISSYLCFNSNPNEETFFKGVYKLNPGHYIKYKNNKITKERYFKFEIEEKEEDMNIIIDKIKKSMNNSISHHLISDVEVGSFLSSGIDSSYLVSASKVKKTYTVGYEDKEYDEISYAEDLTKKLKIKNKTKNITKQEYMDILPKFLYHMDEPLADPSAVAISFVSQIACEDVKVIMTGEGADELFAGYLSYREEIDNKWYNKIPYIIRHIASIITTPLQDLRGFNFIYRRGQKLKDYYIGLARVFTDKEAKSILKIGNQKHTKDILAPFYKDYKNSSNLGVRQALDFYYWLIPDFLQAADRTTMMYGIEGRTPFLDLEVYKVAKNLPFNAKLNKETTKVALRQAAKSVIPNEAYKKRKLGFPVPLRAWMREEDVYNQIKEKFTSETANKFFKENKILKLLEEHKSKKKDCFKKIWAIYVFIIWYEIYFTDNK